MWRSDILSVRAAIPIRSALLLVGAALLFTACGGSADTPPGEAESTSTRDSEQVVYVYSGRHYGLMEPAFIQFTQETGIKVRFTFGKEAELHERLLAEGRFTPADLLFTVDAGNLWLAARDGLLQPIESEILTSNIPVHLRDPENQWFALSVRARTIMYSTERVDPDELSTYEDLADPRWQGRLCLRPSTKVYTQSIVASLIAAHGETEAESIVAGWVANEPVYIDSDTRILKALEAGECDVAIANTYYLGRILNENPDFAVKLFWANQDDRGVHVNISGGGVTTHARNVENAIRLLEWLSGPGQNLFADGNFEYPANPDIEPHPLLSSWGSFKEDSVFANEFGRLQADALRLLDRTGHE